VLSITLWEHVEEREESCGEQNHGSMLFCAPGHIVGAVWIGLSRVRDSGGRGIEMVRNGIQQAGRE
jgi:hypothetical protein